MISCRRNCKEIKGKSFGARKSVKQGKKQRSVRFRSLKEASVKSFHSLRPLFAKIFAAAKHPLGTRVPFRSTVPLISQLQNEL